MDTMNIKNKKKLNYVNLLRIYLVILISSTINLNAKNDDFSEFINLSIQLAQNPDELAFKLNDTLFVHSSSIKIFSKKKIDCLISQIKLLNKLSYKYESTMITTYHIDLLVNVVMANKRNLFYFMYFKFKTQLSELR